MKFDLALDLAITVTGVILALTVNKAFAFFAVVGLAVLLADLRARWQ